jgi:hypothetical protein
VSALLPILDSLAKGSDVDYSVWTALLVGAIVGGISAGLSAVIAVLPVFSDDDDIGMKRWADHCLRLDLGAAEKWSDRGSPFRPFRGSEVPRRKGTVGSRLAGQPSPGERAVDRSDRHLRAADEAYAPVSGMGQPGVVVPSDRLGRLASNPRTDFREGISR